MKVKICGIMEPLHGQWAVEAGADFVGLIFAPSRRQVSPEKALAIKERLVEAGLKDKTSLVGVFVNEDPLAVNEIAEECGLDCVQLSGDEPWDYCRSIRRPVVKAVKLSPGFSAADVSAELEREWQRLDGRKLAVLIEPRVSGAHGGTGKRLEWDSLGRSALGGCSVPLLLAGGLDPDNVESACRLVRPWGVDVSSGVETGGVKDEGKIKAFVAAARRSV